MTGIERFCLGYLVADNTYEANHDAWHDEANQTTAYGEDTTLTYGLYVYGEKAPYSTEVFHGWLEFDVGVGAACSSAKLRIYVESIDGEGDNGTRVGRGTRTDADETKQTWLIYKEGSNWTTGGGDTDPFDYAGDDDWPAATGWQESTLADLGAGHRLKELVDDARASRGGQLILRIQAYQIGNDMAYDEYYTIRTREYTGDYAPRVIVTEAGAATPWTHATVFSVRTPTWKRLLRWPERWVRQPETGLMLPRVA